jgi:hypothetical protein
MAPQNTQRNSPTVAAFRPWRGSASICRSSVPLPLYAIIGVVQTRFHRKRSYPHDLIKEGRESVPVLGVWNTRKTSDWERNNRQKPIWKGWGVVSTACGRGAECNNASAEVHKSSPISSGRYPQKVPFIHKLWIVIHKMGKMAVSTETQKQRVVHDSLLLCFCLCVVLRR